MDIKQKVLAALPALEPYWDEASDLFSLKTVPAKTTLLEAGDTSKYIFIVSRGCLRIFVIREDGREITVQFFFENQMVASMESAFTGKPGNLYLESLEESELLMIKLEDFRGIVSRHESLKDVMI